MEKAYYAVTDFGPFRKGQVVVLDQQDGWVRSGYLRELVDPAPGRPGWNGMPVAPPPAR
jgi:hypothetical protein